MQPVVGILADSSTSKWGRRRPFMVGGALIVGVFLVVLGWTSEIVSMFVAEEHLVRTGPEIADQTMAETWHSTNHAPYSLLFSVSTWSTLQSMLVGDRAQDSSALADSSIKSKPRAEVLSLTLCPSRSSSSAQPGVGHCLSIYPRTKIEILKQVG